MKNHDTSLLFALLFVTLTIAGCAASAMSPVRGALYTDAKGPVAATSLAEGTEAPKMGTASATSILGLLGTGDASIEAAMDEGNITSVYWVDYESYGILGIYAEYTVIVYGE